MEIISIREHPEYVSQCIQYFSEKWGLDNRIYEDCITHSLKADSPLPRFYLMIKDKKIIGAYSIIINDFVSRQDLWPYLSALYIEESERGNALGSVLLNHGREEAFKLGFSKIYLCTDHIQYYEKYGWTCITEGFHPWKRKSNIYVANTIQSK